MGHLIGFGLVGVGLGLTVLAIVVRRHRRACFYAGFAPALLGYFGWLAEIGAGL